MTNLNNDSDIHIDRLFQTAAQWIGLQRTAGTILAALYSESSQDEKLSVSDICDKTGLSISTVSSICSHLETLGIIVRQSEDQQQGRGRRKTVLSLRVGIDGLLRQGMNRYLEEISRILRDIESTMESSDFETGNSIQRALSEITLFLTEPFSIS
ncbi:MAG: MarR family transcriptional regulator [Candidatus Thorarchaeota archaeon]